MYGPAPRKITTLSHPIFSIIRDPSVTISTKAQLIGDGALITGLENLSATTLASTKGKLMALGNDDLVETLDRIQNANEAQSYDQRCMWYQSISDSCPNNV